MKKIVLFLCVIGVATMMTSCLETNNSFNEPAFVYIAVAENGVVYGRTSGFFAHLITSPQIQQGHITPPTTGSPIIIRPGYFFWMHYGWDEANSFTALGERVYANNVTILGMTNKLEQADLFSWTAPEPDQRLVGLEAPIFSDDPIYWSDNWVITYNFIGGGDIMPTLSFYKRDIPENNSNSSDITIDIDVRIEGIPQVANPQPRVNWVILNMADLRRELQQENSRSVIVKFHFYQPDSDTPTSITAPRWTIGGTS